MRKVHYPAVVFLDGHRYQLSADQWQRLAPQIKGLTSRQAAPIGQAFLIAEGVIKVNAPSKPCAWCQKAKGEVSGPGVSHGICERHAAEFMREGVGRLAMDKAEAP
jgi:hypothetical protein